MLNGVLAGLLTLLPPGLQSAPAPPSSPPRVTQQAPAPDLEFRWRDHP
jgi:hypothetical protein